MTDERGEVTGTHRPAVAPLWLLWAATGVVNGVLAVAFALQARWTWVGITALLLASSIGNLARLRTAGTTTVSPEGLRVRRGFGWRSYAWDDVASIDRPRTIFGYDTGLIVRTRDGDTIPVAVPPRLVDALVDYGEQHRARRRTLGPESLYAPARKSENRVSRSLITKLVIWSLLVAVGVALAFVARSRPIGLASGLGFMVLGVLGIVWTVRSDHE